VKRDVARRRHEAASRIDAAEAQTNLRCAARRRAEIVDADDDVGCLTYDGITCGADDAELAVALIVAADDQRVKGRMQRGGARDVRVVHLAIGDGYGPGDA